MESLCFGSGGNEFMFAISAYVCIRDSDFGSDDTFGAKRNVDGIDCYRIHRNICTHMAVSLTALQSQVKRALGYSSCVRTSSGYIFLLR